MEVANWTSGAITIPNIYQSGNLHVYVNGARVADTRITETTTTSVTVSGLVATDRINIDYFY